MSDLTNKNSHPLSIADETARYRMRDDSEERGGQEKWNPEEISDNGPDTPFEHSRNAPSTDGYSRRGGGISGHDLLRDDSESGYNNIDPELLIIGPDEVINKGYNGNNPKKEWKMRIDLNKVGYSSPVYDKLADLGKIWTDPSTQIVYTVGENPESDKITFKNPKLKWRSEKDSGERSITVQEFDETLHKSEIRLSISRPKDEKDVTFVNDLKHLVLGTGILVTDKVEVEFSKVAQEKVKEDKNFFNLKINDKALDRFTTSEDKSAVKDVCGLWTHAGKGEIEWVGFELSKDGQQITGVTLVEKEGGWKDKLTVPAHVFRTVMENVLPHKRDGRPTGFEFVVPGGMKESIHPGMSPEQVSEVMKKVKIDGVGLQENVKFFIGGNFQKL